MITITEKAAKKPWSSLPATSFPRVCASAYAVAVARA